MHYLLIAALAALPTFGYLSMSSDTSDITGDAPNPSVEVVLGLAEMLTGEVVDGGAQTDADNARLFLWELQRPGVLSTCVAARMDAATEHGTLDRDLAVLFLADLVDGTDSIATCDAAAVQTAEAQLEAMGLELPTAELTTQGTFNANTLLDEAQDQRSRLRRAFERNN